MKKLSIIAGLSIVLFGSKVLLASISNQAVASWTNPDNSTHSANSNTVVVDTPPIITLVKSADKTTASSGTTITYTIVYTNIGKDPATGVAVTDMIAAGTTYVPGSASNGGSLSGSTLTWNIGSLSANASGSVSFSVTVN